MNRTLSSPPPEWAPQSALMIGWPSHADVWEEPFEAARREIAAMANLILTTSPTNGLAATDVMLVADGEAAAEAARAAVPGANIFNTACGDTWLRDTGPILSFETDRLQARTFGFNGWGEKYIYPGDVDLAARISAALNAEVCPFSFVLEGGSVDWDAAGAVLTTEECLLNPNRNPGWKRTDAEQALAAAFGASDVIWIRQGLLNDHTDGHIDNLARFVGKRRVVCQAPLNTDDPHTERLIAVRRDLESFRFRDGGALEIVPVPSPGRVLSEGGEVMPASHMNFVITNQAVIVPGYNDHVGEAVRVLAELFPDRNVLASPANAILTGGGAFHCISQQIPENAGENHA